MWKHSSSQRVGRSRYLIRFVPIARRADERTDPFLDDIRRYRLGVPDSHVVIRLLGPTIEAVCVALQSQGSALPLQASFPVMLMSAGPVESTARAHVAASRGGVEVRIEGSNAPFALASLSEALGCVALVARRLPAIAYGYTSLLLRGRVIWEEEQGASGPPSAYRLACPALGVDLRGRAGSVAPAARAEAWRAIDAHVDALVGSVAIRALSFEGGPTIPG